MSGIIPCLPGLIPSTTEDSDDIRHVWAPRELLDRCLAWRAPNVRIVETLGLTDDGISSDIQRELKLLVSSAL